MGGKRRNTAKTGDKSIYKSRGGNKDDANDEHNKRQERRRRDAEDDPVHDAIDRFHNHQQDFVAFDDPNRNDDDDGASVEEEAVMDLAAGGDDSSSSSSSSEEDHDDEDSSRGSAEPDEEQDGPVEEYDDDDDMEDDVILDEEEEEVVNIRDWGQRKSAYYHGDVTTDLVDDNNKKKKKKKKGHDDDEPEEDDAFDEEEAAKEVQRERFQKMADEDFMIPSDDSDDDDGENEKKDATMEPQRKSSLTTAGPATTKAKQREPKVANKRERLKILDREHPEVLPLLHHFADVARDLQNNTMVATTAIFDGEPGTAKSIGATPAGLQWLLNKAVVQTTATLNLAVYLMLKREAMAHGQDLAMMQTHPIMAHLQKWNTTLGQIQDVEAQHGLAAQMRHVVRAASLLSGDAISVSSEDDGDESHSGDNSSSEDDEDNVHVDQYVEETGNVERSLVAGGSEDSSSSEDDDDEDENSPSDDEDETERARSVLTEARFGLRPNEVANHDESGRKRRRAVMLDAGDDEDRVVTAAATANAKQKSKKSKSSSLAGTLNSIEQRTANKTKKVIQATEDVDDDTKVRRGLEMMEEELGPDSDDEGKPNTKDNADKNERGRAGKKEDEGDDDNNNEFYDKLSKRSQAHRDYKKQLHAVAPKFPRVDGMVTGERAASRHIIKNRGLVAHKKKINRNPRVKKREQFRKALIRRKGAVREVRKDEGHRYGGEETGIKTNLSRSRKLA